MKTTGTIITAFLLIVTGCATTTETPPPQPQSQPQSQLPSKTQPDGNYYYSELLDANTVKLGDTSVRPPVLFKEYTFRVGRMPLLARLKAEIFHQGSSELPIVRVNGKSAGTLSPHWNDLSSQNYDIIFFDKNEGYSQVLDYNDWITADLFISPEILRPGENRLMITTARAGTDNADDIGLRNVEIEFRYLDREDTVTDLRRKSRNLPLPYLPAGGTGLTQVAGGADSRALFLDNNILQELQAIRKLLEKETTTRKKDESSSVCGSRSRRGPDEEALARIKLPANPTDEEIRNYIREIRQITKDQTSFSSRDPQVEMLSRVGPEHLDILIDILRLNPQRSYHIKEAINRLAQSEHKDLILEALPRMPDLIEAVVDNGWVEEARPILIEKLKTRPDSLPLKWVKAVASFKDPETYNDLKNYFIYCWNPSMVYEAIKDLPGIELTDTVAKAWERAKYGHEFQSTMMVPVAIEFGHLDALARAVKDIDVDSGNRVHNARKLVMRFTEARGSGDDIRKWFEDNKDRLTFDREKGRFIIPAAAGENAAGNELSEEENPQVDTDTREKSNDETRKQEAKNTKGDKRPSGGSALSANTLKRGDPVPDFKVKALDGQIISLEDLRGKVVLLDFWATWCPPCRPEIPRIREAYLKYHDRGLEVIGISLDNDKNKLEKFIEENKVTWPQVFDGKGWNSALAQLYGVHSIPRPLLLDRETRIYTPNARGEELDRALTELFKENNPVIETPS